jgi:hypothetical protein
MLRLTSTAGSKSKNTSHWVLCMAGLRSNSSGKCERKFAFHQSRRGKIASSLSSRHFNDVVVSHPCHSLPSLDLAWPTSTPRPSIHEVSWMMTPRPTQGRPPAQGQAPAACTRRRGSSSRRRISVGAQAWRGGRPWPWSSIYVFVNGFRCWSLLLYKRICIYCKWEAQ